MAFKKNLQLLKEHLFNILFSDKLVLFRHEGHYLSSYLLLWNATTVLPSDTSLCYFEKRYVLFQLLCVLSV